MIYLGCIQLDSSLRPSLSPDAITESHGILYTGRRAHEGTDDQNTADEYDVKIAPEGRHLPAVAHLALNVQATIHAAALSRVPAANAIEG